MKILKTNWLLKHTLTVLSCVLIVVLGIAFLSQADPVTTTIGENIATNDLSVTGNVTAGTWQGDLVATEYGGTGADWSAVAQGNLPYFSAEGVLSNLAPGTDGQFLQSGGTGADPAWANVTRSATFIVAANDSSTLSKQQADYVCDGTDDQVEIQEAIDALPTSGGSVLLSEGTFVLDAPNDFYVNDSKYALNVHGDNVELVGSRGAILKLKDGIDVGGGAANTFVATIIINGNNISIRNIHFDNNYTNITVDYNLAIWTGDSTTPILGNYVDISYNYFEGVERYTIWGDGGGEYWNIHHNILVPDGAAGIAFHNGPSRSKITDNIIANITTTIGVGIFIDSVDHIIISGNHIRRPQFYGINLYDDVNYCVISNNIIENYFGTPVGIFVNSKVSEDSSNNSNMIQGNSFVNIPSGIVLNDSYVKNTVIKNNQFVSVTTPITNSGTDSVIQNNIGYTTESSGTATLANTTTSIAVTHGLAVTPSAGDITITPIKAWGAMTEFYIDTYTSTQFTIHADQDPTQDVDFAWKAIAL